MQLRQAGDRGVLAELGAAVGFDELHAAAAAARSIPGVAACIVGQSSLYLILDSVETRDAVLHSLSSISIERSSENGQRRTENHRVHRIPVNFDSQNAPDLDLLLKATSLTREQFIAAISEIRFRARYLGFRAGFAYLDGLPAEWTVPRRPSPRVRVPSGSFATAAGMTAFYPSESPGGWNLIGRSSAVFWDPWKEPPNLIAAGDEVRIVPTAEAIRREEKSEQRRFASAAALADVLRPGQLTMMVGKPDLRRYEFGLPEGGAFDRDAAAAANRAAGNSSDAAVLECALVGPQLLFHGAAVLSWYGAPAEILLDDHEIRDPRRFEVRAGKVVTIGRLQGSLRGYLAINGGFVNPAPKYGLVPASLSARDMLERAGEETQPADVAPLRRGDPHMIEVVLGPHEVQSRELEVLREQLWEVTPSLDRTGIRFRPVHRMFSPPADLPSCGMQFGTVQWHPSGELVAVGPDHPVTGGYLQPMTILSSERWKLAQLVPGDRVRWLLARGAVSS